MDAFESQQQHWHQFCVGNPNQGEVNLGTGTHSLFSKQLCESEFGTHDHEIPKAEKGMSDLHTGHCDKIGGWMHSIPNLATAMSCVHDDAFNVNHTSAEVAAETEDLTVEISAAVRDFLSGKCWGHEDDENEEQTQEETPDQEINQDEEDELEWKLLREAVPDEFEQIDDLFAIEDNLHFAESQTMSSHQNSKMHLDDFHYMYADIGDVADAEEAGQSYEGQEREEAWSTTNATCESFGQTHSKKTTLLLQHSLLSSSTPGSQEVDVHSRDFHYQVSHWLLQQLSSESHATSVAFSDSSKGLFSAADGTCQNDEKPVAAGKGPQLELSKLVLPGPSADKTPACIVRGQMLSRIVRTLPFPADVPTEQLVQFDETLQKIIKQLLANRMMPTISTVQRCLRNSGVSETMVLAVLNLCALYSHRYCFWIPSNGEELSIIPLERPLPPLSEKAELRFDFVLSQLLSQRLSCSASVAVLLTAAQPSAFAEQLSTKENVSVKGFPGGRVDTSHTFASEVPAFARMLKNQGITTVMLRNLPCTVTQKQLLQELAASGFEGCFDFCYLPASFKNGTSKGYAFVNLINSDVLEMFVLKWHGSRRFGISQLDATITVSAATIQGKEENTKKWNAPRMKRVRNPALRPLVISSDVPIDTSQN